ncbi:MAG: carbohydrate kinase family protein [Rhodospirillales bacterium]|nr:carbohydrate kinase family protein [Rhodospirillales bacterium]
MPCRGLISGGSVVTDIIKMIARSPPQDETSVVRSIKRWGGGPALNILLNLRNLGAEYPLATIGTTGDDDHGDFLRSLLNNHDVNTDRLITIPGQPSAQVDVMTVEATGRRTFFYLPGAADMTTADLFDFTDTPFDVFHTGAPGLMAGLDRRDANGDNGFVNTLRKAKQAGLFTNMELATIEPDHLCEVTLPCLALLDSIIINEHEAGMLAGIDPRPNGKVDWDRVEDAARRLRDLGVSTLIGIHFPEGGIAMDKEGCFFRQSSVAMPENEIISAVGAGDAFASGLMFGFLDGWETARSMRLAVANAAVSLLSDTTTGSIKPWRDALDFADARGFRSQP